MIVRKLLAIEGGVPTIDGPLDRYDSITQYELHAAESAMQRGPLSGYLGGQRHGGYFCERLEKDFAEAVGSRHAVCVNSATSGLLGACHVVGVNRDSVVVTTPYTMSATAAAPAFLGAQVAFGDIEDKTFCLDVSPWDATKWMPAGDAVIVTNLFGHPANLTGWRDMCKKTPLIEDNAQAPFAMEGNRYAGTVADIGVFSFNIHKHIHAGEGGICVTNYDSLAERLRLFRNHGELSGGTPGLNLRLTEIAAAIVQSQLMRREEIINGRIELAEHMTWMVKDFPHLRAPVVREGCRHVYYCWALLVDNDYRDWFVRAMNAEGIPMRAGYSPLHKLKAFPSGSCPVTDAVEKKIALFEICTYDPSRRQLRKMEAAFQKVGSELERRISIHAEGTAA